MKPESDTYSAVGEVGVVHERRSLWTRAIIDLRKAPYTALFGMIIILAYALVAIFAPILAPYGEAQVSLNRTPLGAQLIFLVLIKLVEIFSHA